MIILLTQGDINGIGPEVILKSIKKLQLPHSKLDAKYIAVGSFREFEVHNKELKLKLQLIPISSISEAQKLPHNTLPVVDIPHRAITRFGLCRSDAGDLSMKAIQVATLLCMNKEAHAIVTAPINKEAISKAGWKFQGHTDFLAKLTNSRVQMLLCDEPSSFRVALATVHVPIKDVSKELRKKGISESIHHLNTALVNEFGIKSPRIAVLGLNPHASDGGVIGKDESEYLQPELKKLKRKYRVEGFFAADGFFGSKQYLYYDGVLAMYHDQALIPFKMLAFETGVNTSIGLPFVRTSPDHGTAFDIAGKGIANELSFFSAVKLAIKLSKARLKI